MPVVILMLIMMVMVIQMMPMTIMMILIILDRSLEPLFVCKSLVVLLYQ